MSAEHEEKTSEYQARLSATQWLGSLFPRTDSQHGISVPGRIQTIRESARELHRTRIREATVAGLYEYSPRPYGGAVTLILGERFEEGSGSKNEADWQNVCSGPLEVFRIPGRTTGEMMKPPIVDTLVRQIKNLLERNG